LIDGPIAAEGTSMTLNSRSATWTLTRAKAHFSQLIERAQASPQIITWQGESKAVMVSAQEWARKPARKGTLAEFLLASPLRDVPMDIECIRDRPRDFEP
jgi:prevent-host-death family protein